MAAHTISTQPSKVRAVDSYLRAFRDRLVMEVQEAKSRCLSLEQNLLRLVHVLKQNIQDALIQKIYSKPSTFHMTCIILSTARTSLAFP